MNSERQTSVAASVTGTQLDPEYRSMKSNRFNAAVEHIREVTDRQITESDLFLKSMPVSSWRLRLAMSREADRVEITRVPSSFLWAHGITAWKILILRAIGCHEPQKATAGDWISGVAVTIVIAAGSYGFTIRANAQAEREGPVVSYDLQERVLTAGQERKRIDRDAICCIVALASVPRKAHRPHTRSELKIIFRADSTSVTDSIVIAKNLSLKLKDYDDEITPFARGLKVPCLHVHRSHTNDFRIDRVV